MRERLRPKGERGKKGEKQDWAKKERDGKAYLRKKDKNMKGIGQRKRRRVEGALC
jgi:hypothetical protein